MSLSLSLLIAALVLGLRLMIQSVVLGATTENQLVKVARRVKGLNWPIFAIGLIMPIIGFVFSSYRDSFVSVGVTLMITSLTLYVQSLALISKGDQAQTLSRQLRLYAWLCVAFVGACLLAIVISLAVIVATR